MLEYKPDAIVAVGGGSAIDSSKSIREFALRVDHYAEVGLIAIPTTSGTGSEVTSFAVVSDPAEQRKYPLVSWELTPTISNPRCRTCKECASGDYSRYRNGRIYTRT